MKNQALILICATIHEGTIYSSEWSVKPTLLSVSAGHLKCLDPGIRLAGSVLVTPGALSVANKRETKIISGNH